MLTRSGAARHRAAPLRAFVLAAAATLLGAGPALAQSPRVPELVSPPGNTGDMVSLGLYSATGQAAAYTSWGIFAGMPQTGQPETYVAQRAASGWQTFPVVTLGKDAVLLAIADDLPRVIWSSSTAIDPLDVNPGTADLYLRDETGTTTRLTSGPADDAGVTGDFAGASGDLSTIFFETTTKL